MRVQEIWRYPVKTMAGERLDRAEIGPRGIAGDRLVHVQDVHGRIVTSRSTPRFLAHKGTFASAALVDGRPWDSAEVAAEVAGIAGEGARLVETSEGSFDRLPLLITTDGALAAFGHDYRRLRPNLIISGVDGLAEFAWLGRRLRIGRVLVGIEDLRRRCVMTSYDPDTQVQDMSVTEDIVQRFEGRFGLNCFVIEPGEIAVGDEVVLS